MGIPLICISLVLTPTNTPRYTIVGVEPHQQPSIHHCGGSNPANSPRYTRVGVLVPPTPLDTPLLSYVPLMQESGIHPRKLYILCKCSCKTDYMAQPLVNLGRSRSLPCDAMHKRGLCRHAVSVCLSLSLSLYVCVSVTFVSCVKTNKHIIEFFFTIGQPRHSSFSMPNGVAISSSSSLFVQIKIHDAKTVQTIKPEQSRKTTLTAALEQKKKKNTEFA